MNIMIAALAGRRIDANDTKNTQFPLEMKNRVYEEIYKFLRKRDINMLISSAACGADLLAQKAAGELGIEQHIILPFNHEKFIETSVTDRPGNWGKLFDEIYNKVADENNVLILNEFEDEESAYSAVTEEIINRAKELNQKKDQIIAIVVWEGNARSEDDETRAFYEKAKAEKFEVTEIPTIY